MPKDKHQFHDNTSAERARTRMIQKRVENSYKSVMLFHRGQSTAVNRRTATICREVNTCAPESAVITCFSGSHKHHPHDSTSLIKYPKRRRKGNYLIVFHSKYM